MRNSTKKTTIIALASSMVMAAAAPAAFARSEDKPFDGAYFGGSVSLDKFNTDASVNPNVAGTMMGKKKLGLGIYGGYGMQMDQLYFGLEGGFRLNRNASPTYNFGTTKTGLKTKNTIDLAARVGFVADRVLFYGLAGFTATKFDTFGLAKNIDKRLSGFRFGGGVEFALTPELSVRAEYTRANYKKWDVKDAANTITFDPNANRFLVGATLRF